MGRQPGRRQRPHDDSPGQLDAVRTRRLEAPAHVSADPADRGRKGAGADPAGILAQESNISQASWHAAPGDLGNPLVGNFYGAATQPDLTDPWYIDFAEADCGYGIASGHRRNEDRPTVADGSPETSDHPRLRHQHRCRLNILISKWNALQKDGMTINNNDAEMDRELVLRGLGLQLRLLPQGDGQRPSFPTAWGVGWFNNPANPIYPPNRAPS